MLIQAVIFDLDGTLLNRDASVVSFIHDQYDRLHEHLLHIPKEVYTNRFIQLDERGYVWKDRVYAQLIEEFLITNITADELLNDYLQQFKNHCVPFNHLHKMLGELKQKGIKLGMITNGYGQFQLDNIRALGIESYFDAILLSEWEGIKKPNPVIFERAMSKLNVPAHACLFIGDHPTNDVEAAKNAGMISVWKKDLAWKDVKTEHIVDDLVDVVGIVDGLG